MRVLFLSIILSFILGCFPKNYNKIPSSDDILYVTKVSQKRKILVKETRKEKYYSVITTRGRDTYKVKGRGFYIQTEYCPVKQGEALYTFWEFLLFENGTQCAITSVYSVSIDDYARLKK